MWSRTHYVHELSGRYMPVAALSRRTPPSRNKFWGVSNNSPPDVVGDIAVVLKGSAWAACSRGGDGKKERQLGGGVELVVMV